MPFIDDAGQRYDSKGETRSSRTKKAKIAAAAKRRSEHSSMKSGKGTKRRTSSPSAYRSSVVKNYDWNNKHASAGSNKTKQSDAAMFKYRMDRKKTGNFKGDYYGPDEFKGNLDLVDKWRKAGSPKNRSTFAKRYNKRLKSITSSK